MLNPLFYIQAIALALSQIWANKLRSFLTALGIIIGVASVAAVIAALTGLKTFVLDQFESVGASKLFVFPDFPDGEDRNKYTWSEVRMKVPELRAVQQCESIKQVTPFTDFRRTVRIDEDRAAVASGMGVWQTWHEIENRDVIIGRPLTQADEDGARQVCLINDKAIENLGLDSDPTNTHIIFDNRRFLIVGVVENKKDNMFAEFGPSGIDVEVLMPFSTAMKMQGSEPFFFIQAQLHSPEAAEEAKAEVRFLLRRMRDLDAGEVDTFEVVSLDQFIDQFKALAAGVTTIAGGIVAISLLVGGIGIMNIMLVSVSERTREIGLRKAVGATPAAILMQFLLEAVTLCMLGGLAGLAIGQGFAVALSKMPDSGMEQASVPGWAVALALIFSGTVGVVFGMFPAIKAARLDPIVALRHE